MFKKLSILLVLLFFLASFSTMSYSKQKDKGNEAVIESIFEQYKEEFRDPSLQWKKMRLQGFYVDQGYLERYRLKTNNITITIDWGKTKESVEKLTIYFYLNLFTVLWCGPASPHSFSFWFEDGKLEEADWKSDLQRDIFLWFVKYNIFQREELSPNIRRAVSEAVLENF